MSECVYWLVNDNTKTRRRISLDEAESLVQKKVGVVRMNQFMNELDFGTRPCIGDVNDAGDNLERTLE
ncbi:MAG TPA: hypothetical protein PKA41_11090 [Verrucomicrobiota bacterium]|nr:hypothetical protein [Verrucomicrobiota bacterium]